MNKEIFKNEFNMELEDMSITEIKNLINELLNEVSSNYYEYLLCKIKYLKGEEYDNIIDNFDEFYREWSHYLKDKNNS